MSITKIKNIYHKHYEIGIEMASDNWKDFFDKLAEALKDVKLSQVLRIILEGDKITVEEISIYGRDENNKIVRLE